jgi:hypothetical protein
MSSLRVCYITDFRAPFCVLQVDPPLSVLFAVSVPYNCLSLVVHLVTPCNFFAQLWICILTFLPLRVFQGYHPVSPDQEAMMSSGLPPMSTFRGGPTTSSYTNTSPTVNGSDMIASRGSHGNQGATSQTGDALGKALASVSNLHTKKTPKNPQICICAS